MAWSWTDRIGERQLFFFYLFLRSPFSPESLSAVVPNPLVWVSSQKLQPNPRLTHTQASAHCSLVKQKTRFCPHFSWMGVRMQGRGEELVTQEDALCKKDVVKGNVQGVERVTWS